MKTKTKKKAVKIVAELEPEEIDFLAGMLVVSNAGHAPVVDEKGWSVDWWFPKDRRAPLFAHGKLMDGRGWVDTWFQYAGQDIASIGITEGQFWRDLMAEKKDFEKSLKKGLPSYWNDLLPALEHYRAAAAEFADEKNEKEKEAVERLER